MTGGQGPAVWLLNSRPGSALLLPLTVCTCTVTQLLAGEGALATAKTGKQEMRLGSTVLPSLMLQTPELPLAS